MIYSTAPVRLYPRTEASLPSHPLVMHACMYQCLKGKQGMDISTFQNHVPLVSVVVVITLLPIEALKSGENDPV